MKDWLARFLNRYSLRRQISIAVAAGIIGVALCSFLVNSWQGTRLLRNDLLRQGERITESLARHSVLGLLTGSAENAAEAVKATLAFPGVVRVDIHDTANHTLLTQSRKDIAWPAISAAPISISDRAALTGENQAVWRFDAPVYPQESTASPFELQPAPPVLLGTVSVAMSKTALVQMTRDMFIGNLVTTGSFTLVFLALLAYLTRRMTRPLTRLSGAMAQAEAGAAHVRAPPSGPRDIAYMAERFNRMMQVLEEREEELRLAHDEALAFGKLKADFAVTVSHEIRTPVNGVIGMLEVLRVMRLPQQQREFVDMAWNSASSLLNVINDILDFSKLDAGKMELESHDFDPRAIIEETVDLFAVPAHQKGLEIGQLVGADVPRLVCSDARRLRQILVNLVSNAVKFTQHGEVAIRLGVSAQANDPPRLCFDVVDTGIGIAPLLLNHVFESFARAAQEPTRQYGGTGLGLAISRQLVTLLGGEIGVDSAPGAGSRFWFTLPLPAVSTQVDDVRTAVPCHVLVVEDSTIVRDFLLQTLGAWGFPCCAVRDAITAMNALRQATRRNQPFAQVILDASFAAARGGELIHHIRANYPAIRLVVMDRFGSGADSMEYWEADGRLLKPLNAARLEKCLAALPERPGTAPAEGADTPQPLCRILVVADTRTNQAVIAGMLATLRCHCVIAAGGQDALEKLEDDHFDLILMNCSMPAMNGYETTARFRAQEEQAANRERTPIVGMTAGTGLADVKRCLAAGMDDHLSNPLLLEALAEKIQLWTGRRLTRPSLSVAFRAKSRATDESDPLDQNTLSTLQESLGEAMGQAIRLFLEDLPGYLFHLEESYRQGDTTSASDIAHAITGSAGNLGATRLATLARELKQRSPADMLSGHDTDMMELIEESMRVRAALSEELRHITEAASKSSENAALVLVVDDDRSTRATLSFALHRDGFRVEEATNGLEALEMAQRTAPDLVLMDAMMPVMDGITACAKLKEMPGMAELPVMMITALEDTDAISRAFAAGASDYIAKPMHLAVVSLRVRRIIESNRAEQHVRHLAYNDTLTGLANRVRFIEYLGGLIHESPQDFAVLFLDLDRFKYVNDSLGHDIGDHLLVAVARRIQQCLRNNDCVARFGGDEFTIILENLADPASAAAVAAQKIRRALASPFEVDSHEIFISTSIGIALYPADGTEVNMLLKQADTAMYKAKHANSGYTFYETGMEASLSACLKLESALRRALERNELTVFYQPKGDARSGAATGSEALLRWRHPERGFVSPTEFIPIAEETGLIIPIGDWVLRTVCIEARAWQNRGLSLPVAVNISALQIRQKDFVERVAAILAESGLDPGLLELEITESVLMEQARETLSTLHRLKELGVTLAIDDFGTGYSSLAYLKRFPVDTLKIDRSFVHEAHSNPDDAAIVSGIIALAHTLRLSVVAEGVETEAQRQFLISSGCDFIQGYLLAKPLQAKTCEAHLRARGQVKRALPSTA